MDTNKDQFTTPFITGYILLFTFWILYLILIPFEIFNETHKYSKKINIFFIF